MTQSGGRFLKFFPSTDFVGHAVFSYTATDGQGAVASATVTVVVAPADSESNLQNRSEMRWRPMDGRWNNRQKLWPT